MQLSSSEAGSLSIGGPKRRARSSRAKLRSEDLSYRAFTWTDPQDRKTFNFVPPLEGAFFSIVEMSHDTGMPDSVSSSLPMLAFLPPSVLAQLSAPSSPCPSTSSSSGPLPPSSPSGSNNTLSDITMASKTIAAPGNDRIYNGNDGRLPDPKDDPHLRKLLEAVLFSRRFVVSYQVILAIIVLGIAVARAVRLWKKKQRARHGGKKRSSEGGAGADKDGDAAGERALLLPGPRLLKGTPGWRSRIRAWLMYQPRPIPVVNRALPSNATSMLLLAFAALNVFYTFYRVTLSVPMLFVFADRAALMFVANLPLLYLLAAKNQPVKWLTGYSYEALNIVHRRLGEIMCLLALLHAVGMVGVCYTMLRPVGFGFATFVTRKMIILGIAALVSYNAIYFTSLASFRRRWYELFLGTHVVLQATALVLVYFHHPNSRPYVGVALGVFLIDRIYFRLGRNSALISGDVKVLDDGETVRLSSIVAIDQTTTSHPLGTGNISTGWRATDHVFVTIPSLGREHILQAHPFTIASPAPEPHSHKTRLDLIIRGQDGFSKDLLAFAKCHESIEVRVDGPYGSQHAVENLQSSDSAIIVAGGSGIAVAWPLVWSLVARSPPPCLDLEEDATQANIPPGRRILLVWVIHQDSHLRWIDKSEMNRLQTLGVDVTIPPPTSENGRPDLARIIRNWLALENPLASVFSEGKIGVVCSGRDQMNRNVRNACAMLVREGAEVNVEIEKFGW